MSMGEWGPANVYRDGQVHVVSEKCSTCVFHPGNRMNLAPGRLKEMVEGALRDESVIVCHSTLGTDENAACSGFVETYDPLVIRLARAMNVYTEDPPRSLGAVDSDLRDTP